MVQVRDPVEAQPSVLRHEALFYGCDAEYVAGTAPFIRDGLANDEQILVAVGADKIGLLRDDLGGDATDVIFADMTELGRNPAHIIPEWRAFVEEHATDDNRVRGIGEPIWPGRPADELVECHRHEHLLNLAFADGPTWSLLCPYDTVALPVDVLERARSTHPFVDEGVPWSQSPHYHDICGSALPDDPLSPPPADHLRVPIGAGCLRTLRAFVHEHARDFGLGRNQVADLVLAANELATNTLNHGGGFGTFRMWSQTDAVICDVTDGGHIDHPLVDRTRPEAGQTGGRGLWLANHLCDLVQLRSGTDGTTVRLHIRRET